MLWIFPSLAQPPIVDAVKWTLAAASRACASDTVIQSVAAGIGQSPSELAAFDVGPPRVEDAAFDDEPVSRPVSFAPLLPEALPPEPLPPDPLPPDPLPPEPLPPD